MQQMRAEGVDGLHFQSARRVQRAREQLPRAGAQSGVDLADADLLHRVVKRGIIQRGPGGEPIEHPVRHVRRRGLGECDA